ncbi:MAG: hypothetical protein D6732_15345 [Methanobacteriota archaeon]|nr:MAG: hypothetical protein D6732_15345 [Euryarchaeota archaeon]
MGNYLKFIIHVSSVGFALGKTLPLQSRRPRIIFFRSTFCARCIVSKEIIFNHLTNDEEEDFVELDIGRDLEIFNIAGINFVPTTLVVDEKNVIVGGVEGILTNKSIQPILHLFRSLKKQHSFIE